MQNPTDKATALVLFSGGQDSTTSLAWALDRYTRVETVGFDYGQCHRVELEVRPAIFKAIRREFREWGTHLGEDHMVQLRFDQMTASALLDEGGRIKSRADGLPNTFVPGRNLLFLTYAAIIAESRGLKHVVIGACETDYSGYPDCRDDTIKALQIAVNLGMQTRFSFETPLMRIDKAETWALAHRLGGDSLLELIREQTHTCYAGNRHIRHPWGYGCAECDACRLRARGWERFSSSLPSDGNVAASRRVRL